MLMGNFVMGGSGGHLFPDSSWHLKKETTDILCVLMCVGWGGGGGEANNTVYEVLLVKQNLNLSSPLGNSNFQEIWGTEYHTISKIQNVGNYSTVFLVSSVNKLEENKEKSID